MACGDPKGWREGDLNRMLSLAAEHGYGGPREHEAVRKNVEELLGRTPGENGGIKPSLAVWVNRQAMIAFTHMMLMAETMGYDTAPMEGFHENKVRLALQIPPRIRVVAVLAVGKLEGEDKPFGGRFPFESVMFFERWAGHD